MPTKKQLSDRWASERMFLPNKDDEYNIRGSNMAGSGDDPFSKPFTGEVIGTITVDPETKELKIIIDSEKDKNL